MNLAGGIVARWLFEFDAGPLAPGDRFAQAMEAAAWAVDATCQTSKSGWLVRSYAMRFEGTDDAIESLKRYAFELAKVNGFAV